MTLVTTTGKSSILKAFKLATMIFNAVIYLLRLSYAVMIIGLVLLIGISALAVLFTGNVLISGILFTLMMLVGQLGDLDESDFKFGQNS